MKHVTSLYDDGTDGSGGVEFGYNIGAATPLICRYASIEPLNTDASRELDVMQVFQGAFVLVVQNASVHQLRQEYEGRFGFSMYVLPRHFCNMD